MINFKTTIQELEDIQLCLNAGEGYSWADNLKKLESDIRSIEEQDTYWVVRSEGGFIHTCTLNSYGEKFAIAEFEQKTVLKWDEAKQLGYEVIKVKLVEI